MRTRRSFILFYIVLAIFVLNIVLNKIDGITETTLYYYEKNFAVQAKQRIMLFHEKSLFNSITWWISLLIPESTPGIKELRSTFKKIFLSLNE